MIESLNIQLNLSKAKVVELGEVIADKERRNNLLSERVRLLNDSVNRLELSNNLCSNVTVTPNVSSSSQSNSLPQSQSSQYARQTEQDGSRVVDVLSRLLSTLTSLNDTVVGMSTVMSSHMSECSKNVQVPTNQQ